MEYRWTCWCYDRLRPVIGDRPALWLSEMLPAFAVAFAGLFIFWAVFAVFPAQTGTSSYRECGAGPLKWEC